MYGRYFDSWDCPHHWESTGVSGSDGIAEVEYYMCTNCGSTKHEEIRDPYDDEEPNDH